MLAVPPSGMRAPLGDLKTSRGRNRDARFPASKYRYALVRVRGKVERKVGARASQAFIRRLTGSACTPGWAGGRENDSIAIIELPGRWLCVLET